MDTVLEIATRNAQKARLIAALSLASTLPAPLTYVDVGAAWGVDNALIRALANNKRLRIVGFEPDPAEFNKLRAAFPDDLYLPCGVGDADATRPFYVTVSHASSSFLEPDPDAFAGTPYHDMYRIVGNPQIPLRRFDSLIAEGACPVPDYLKIDSQGYELPILRGLGDHLGKVLGIRLETHLRPLYKGQALFPEIYDFLRSRGFILRDLRITYPFVHEVIELEAFFSLNPQTVGQRFHAMKIWELTHDIPPGRTIILRPGSQGDWQTLPV